PSTGAMLSSRNGNDVASHMHRTQRGLQVGRFRHGNVFILRAENLEKWRIILRDIRDRRSFPDCFLLTLLRNERIKKAMHVPIERNKLEAALRVEADDSLRLCAHAVHRIGGMR